MPTTDEEIREMRKLDEPEHSSAGGLCRRASEFLSKLMRESRVPQKDLEEAADLAIDLANLSKRHVESAVALVHEKHAD